MANRSVSNSLSFQCKAGAHGEANWFPHGQGYRVTFARTVEGKRKRISFDFWGSVHDAQQGKDPTRMEVLECWLQEACSGMEYEDDFQGFCREFGYDYEAALEYERDYRKQSDQRKTWKGCIKMYRKAQTLGFDPGEVWNTEFAGDNYPSDEEIAA